MKTFLEIGSHSYKVFEKSIFSKTSFEIFFSEQEVLQYFLKKNSKNIQVILSGYNFYCKLYKNKNLNKFYLDYLQYSNFQDELYYIKYKDIYQVYSFNTAACKFLKDIKFNNVSLIDWYSTLFKVDSDSVVLDFGHVSTRIVFYQKKMLFYKEIPLGGLQLEFLLMDRYSLQLKEAHLIKESCLYSEEMKKSIEYYYENLLNVVFKNIPKNIQIFLYGQEIKNKILLRKYENIINNSECRV